MRVKVDGDLQFKNHPEIQNLYVIVNDVTFTRHDEVFVLEAGSLTNFASIPYLLRWIFAYSHPHYSLAAAWHDKAVGEHDQEKGVVTSKMGISRRLKWSEASWWFVDLMHDAGAPQYKIRSFRWAILKYNQVKKLFR